VESLVKVAFHALKNKKIFSLNIFAPFIVDFFGDQLAQAMLYADFIFGNESEAAAYGAKHNLGEDIKKIALAVLLPKERRLSSRTVVFTQQGFQSTIVVSDGKVSEYIVDHLAKELLVDTDGAGDAFVGWILVSTR
jgi:adenosine kinase